LGHKKKKKKEERRISRDRSVLREDEDTLGLRRVSLLLLVGRVYMCIGGFTLERGRGG
jgi:hypothetical protein